MGVKDGKGNKKKTPSLTNTNTRKEGMLQESTKSDPSNWSNDDSGHSTNKKGKRGSNLSLFGSLSDRMTVSGSPSATRPRKAFWQRKRRESNNNGKNKKEKRGSDGKGGRR